MKLNTCKCRIVLTWACCFPVQATVAELKKAACALFELDEKDTEVCDHYNNKIYASLESPDKAGKRLEEVQITGPQHIFLGEQVSNMHRPLPESMACLLSLENVVITTRCVRFCKSLFAGTSCRRLILYTRSTTS